MVESLALVGLLVPGVVLITAAASMAGHQMVALPWLIGAAFAGAVLGDGLSYFLGYRHRDTVVTRWPLSLHPEWLGRGARFFERYGIYSVFIGRFVGPVRPIIPLIAGMMHMPARTFLLANVILLFGHRHTFYPATCWATLGNSSSTCPPMLKWPW